MARSQRGPTRSRWNIDRTDYLAVRGVVLVTVLVAVAGYLAPQLWAWACWSPSWPRCSGSASGCGTT